MPIPEHEYLGTMNLHAEHKGDTFEVTVSLVEGKLVLVVERNCVPHGQRTFDLPPKDRK